jgi:hypothetical protein
MMTDDSLLESRLGDKEKATDRAIQISLWDLSGRSTPSKIEKISD